MLDWTPQPPYTAEQLLQVIRILRDPENGCPWDKVQTHASIRKNFLEETCEALEAIDADDPQLMQEELGDVLMQVAFHAVIEEERGHFTFEDVFHGRLFKDNQVSKVFCLWLDKDAEDFTVQKEEIDYVRWFGLEEAIEAVKNNTIPNCIYLEELEMVAAATR